MADLVPLLFIVLAGLLLFVLPMRTRNRQLQQARALQDSLGVGTEVMTTSGLYGTVTGVAEDTVLLEVSDGVVVRWAKAAIAEIRSGAVEPEPVAERTDEPGAG